MNLLPLAVEEKVKKSGRNSMSQDRPMAVYWRMLGYVAAFPGRLTLIVLALGATSASTLAVPWLAKNLFRDAVLHRTPEGMYASLALIVGVLAGIAAFKYCVDVQLSFVSLRMMEHIRNQLTAKLVGLPIGYFMYGRSGDAVSRVFNDVAVLRGFLHYAFFALGSDLLMMVGSVGFLLFLNQRLALFTIATAPIGLAIVVLSSRWIRSGYQRVQAVLSDMTSLLSEQLGAMPAIQAFGAQEHEKGRFADKGREHFRAALRADCTHAGARSAINLLGGLVVAFLLGCSAGEVMTAAGAPGASGLTVDGLIGFALYAGLAAEPLTRLSRTNLEVQQSLAAGRRIFELLDLAVEQRDGPHLLPARPRGHLRFESVCFHYRPGEPVLSGFDLTLEPGETIAVVGASGAGKSTLTYLTLRFYDPIRGRVLLDGRNTRDLRLADLRRHIGWVGQDPFLFSGTVAENIRYGSWKANREEIERAARLACADDFIRELPQGYETRIGERGVNLSGGQRARLALSRVILRSPAIVILDEATASLDTATEVRLWSELAGWLAGRSSLIIAHRLLTVLGRQRIVVLEGGRNVGDGTAEQLQQVCPTFDRIFREQMNLAPAQTWHRAGESDLRVDTLWAAGSKDGAADHHCAPHNSNATTTR